MGRPKKVGKVEIGTDVKKTPVPSKTSGKVTPEELDESLENAKKLFQEGSTSKVEPAEEKTENIKVIFKPHEEVKTNYDVHYKPTEEVKAPEAPNDDVKAPEATADDVKAPEAPVIEKERFRKDLGDLTELKKSIKENGQIHPIVLDTKGMLIAGKRRLQACIELGIEPVFRKVDFTDPEQAEIDENTLRKDFTPSEIFAINKYYNEKLSKQGSRTDINSGANDPEVKKQPREVVSNIAGVGTKTLSKINMIYNSDDDELKKKVDTGKVSIDSGYNKLKKTDKSVAHSAGGSVHTKVKVKTEADIINAQFLTPVEKHAQLILKVRTQYAELKAKLVPSLEPVATADSEGEEGELCNTLDDVESEIETLKRDFLKAIFDMVEVPVEPIE